MHVSPFDSSVSISDISSAVIIQGGATRVEASSGDASGTGPIPGDETASTGEEATLATLRGETEEHADEEITDAVVHTLEAAVAARQHFADRDIPPPAYRPVNVGGPFQITTVLQQTRWWAEIITTASTEYERGILGRNWFSGPSLRLQQARQEIYAAGLKIRETKGVRWEPEFGTYTNSSRAYI